MFLAFHLDDAHPAGTKAGQLGLVAQGRDLYPVVATDLQDGLALKALHDPAVHLHADTRGGLRALRRLGIQQLLGQRLGRRRRSRLALVRAVGADEGVGHRGASVATGSGRLALSNADAKYRIPLVYGRVARRS